MDPLILTILMLMIPAAVIMAIWKMGGGSRREKTMVIGFLLTLLIATFLPDPLLIYDRYAAGGDQLPVVASIGVATALAVVAVYFFRAYRRSP